MSKPRKRRHATARRSSRPSARSWPAGDGASDPARASAASPTLAELKALITDDVLAELDLSLLAEASGQVELAIEHFERHPLAESAPHRQYLYEMRDLGQGAPGWVVSRWILQQAHRWMFLNQDPRLQDAVFLTLGNVYGDVDPEQPLGREPKMFVGEVMAMDWMCRQLALYEMGGLADYLESMVQPSLLRRADRILAWPRAPMSGFRIDGVTAGTATLEDLRTGERREALNIGRLAEGIGMCVVGRLVPLRCEPGWIFDSRPREVSDAVAQEVAEVGAGPRSPRWTGVLGNAVRDGELVWPLDVAACVTPLSSDMLPCRWRCDADAEPSLSMAVEICTNSLDAAQLSEHAAVLAGPYLAVLVDPSVLSAVADRLTSPEHAAGWERLARNTHEPLCSRCLELAARCRVAA